MNNRPINFLVVEDDDDHAAIILRTLEGARGVNSVKRLSDGEEAVAYLHQEGGCASHQRPDIILLDLKLPRMDGHEVLRAIKTDKQLSGIPVVVLSTSNALSDRHKAYAECANSFLVKPVSFQKFRQMLSDLVLYWGVWNEPAPPPEPETGQKGKQHA